MRGKLIAYLKLARFDRPAGIWLLLMPTLWGLWAVSRPSIYWVAVFAGGVVAMRAFGCVVNDIIDRDLDRAVSRTKNRPLAAGVVSVAEAAGVAGVLLLAAAGLFLLLPVAARWWCAPALALALAYPFCKRVMAAPQLALAVAFGAGLLIADITARGAQTPSAQAWWLFVANALWVVAYDTIYAMADRDDDLAYRAAGKPLGSSAILFGRFDRAAVSALYALCLLWLSAGGLVFNYGVAYQVSLIAAAGAVFRFWEKYKTRDARACMAAFRANYWFGLFVFAGLCAAAA